jgi:branched-chain amino acid aminotransferase
LNRACNEVVDRNGIRNGYVRPIAWRGPEGMGVSATGTKPHVAIASWPWPEYYSDDARRKGLRVTVSKWKRPSPETAPTQAKAAGLYMICTLSRHQAEAGGFEDALMWDWRGRVAEATGANLFMVMGGELHTPDPDCFLNGITRQTVMDLARKRGIKVVERAIWPDELSRADEIFLTGTAVEVIPIREIDGTAYTVGPITLQLLDDYSRTVRAR